MANGTRTYYVFCEDNCKFEGMTKEQIITAIEQAIETGSVGDVDAGFITKIKEQNKNKQLKFWVGTKAEYNAIQTKDDNTLYFATDDTSVAELERAMQEIQETIEAIYNAIENIVDGTTEVNKAANARYMCEDDGTTSNVGNSKHPVFIGNGKPTTCDALYNHLVHIQQANMSQTGAITEIYINEYRNTDTEITTLSSLISSLEIGKYYPATGYEGNHIVMALVKRFSQEKQRYVIYVKGFLVTDQSVDEIELEENELMPITITDEKITQLR